MEPKRADRLFTRDEWIALCTWLHNGNPSTHWVQGFVRDDGTVKNGRSMRIPASRGITWAWSSILGTAKRPMSFAPYSQNEAYESRWAGMDFDSHDGNADRAAHLALSAFRCLLNGPHHLILERGGSGGWHLYILATEFRPCREWAQLLKNVAATIGATITPGICEIFPADTKRTKYGKGLRAPGCWSPSSRVPADILFHNIPPTSPIFVSVNCKKAPLNSNDLQKQFTDTENYRIGFSTTAQALLSSHCVTAPSTRYGKLRELVGDAFNRVGFEVARSVARAQYKEKTVATNATEADHLKEFAGLWQWVNDQWASGLTETERQMYSSLEIQSERDAFRIFYSYAQKAKADGAADFPIACQNLADRLGITLPGASKVRDRMVAAGVIRKTANFIPNITSARYAWTADIDEPF